MNAPEQSGYSVPTYQAGAGTTWYHFLHGNVPGHQIDFIFRPDIPQGDLTRQHFSHLTRLMKYIEPRVNTPYAFAIGNLSRDDTQYESGHGGIALIFGLRVKGAVDHAGRQDPPFCHAVVSVDRQFDETTLCEASVQFYEHLLARPDTASDGARWYQSYVLEARQFAVSTLTNIHEYVRAFDALPTPVPSDLGLQWTVDGAAAPRRVVIVYPDGTPFGALAQQMARVAAVLVESDIRWTAISTGRDQDLAGGTTVRFVPESDIAQEPDDVVVMHIRQLPVEPRDIAMLLFGAHEVRLSVTNRLRVQWRHRVETAVVDPLGPTVQVEVRPWARPPEEAEKQPNMDSDIGSSTSLARPNVESETKRRRSGAPILVLALVMGMVGLAGGVGLSFLASRRGVTNEGEGERRPTASLQAPKTAEPQRSADALPPPQEMVTAVPVEQATPSALAPVIAPEEPGRSVEALPVEKPAKTVTTKAPTKVSAPNTNLVRTKVSGGNGKDGESASSVAKPKKSMLRTKLKRP